MVQQIIEIVETIEGNLKVKLIDTPDNREKLYEMVDKDFADGVWADLLEPFSVNGSYSLIEPKTIGSLTEAPIISNEPPYPNEGSNEPYVSPEAKIWHYPDYMIKNEFTELLDNGFVIFTKA
jgi:hypothetical protein